MNYGIIFMTALVPTKGHERLIDFAESATTITGGNVLVIVSSRSHEPKITADRIVALRRRFPYVHFIQHLDDHAPQNCTTDEEWDYWVKMQARYGSNRKIYGSEQYCIEFARRCNTEYVPCDPYREILPIRGTTVRENLFERQGELMSEWVDQVSFTAVMMGQESVGKTTMSKALAREFNTTAIHEWARPYLETVGRELTEQKMKMIVSSQGAIDLSDPGTLVRIQDTDLVATLGYYRINGMTAPLMLGRLINTIRKMPRRLYVVPSDVGVPFTPDQLRYGGDKRESTLEFWLGILDELKLPYIVVEGSLDERIQKAKEEILKRSGFKDVIDFKRD